MKTVSSENLFTHDGIISGWRRDRQREREGRSNKAQCQPPVDPSVWCWFWVNVRSMPGMCGGGSLRMTWVGICEQPATRQHEGGESARCQADHPSSSQQQFSGYAPAIRLNGLRWMNRIEMMYEVSQQRKPTTQLNLNMWAHYLSINFKAVAAFKLIPNGGPSQVHSNYQGLGLRSQVRGIAFCSTRCLLC